MSWGVPFAVRTGPFTGPGCMKTVAFRVALHRAMASAAGPMSSAAQASLT
jgi:hypothetical protein